MEKKKGGGFIVLLKVKRHPSLGLPDAASGRRMVALLDEVITPSLGGGRSGGCERTGPLAPPVQCQPVLGKIIAVRSSRGGRNGYAAYPKG